MKNLRSEMEQGATQAPLGGAFYLRTVYDEEKRRPMPLMVPIDDVLLPYAASSYYSAERITFVDHITEFEFDRRVNSGRYIDAELGAPSQAPEQTKAAKATDKVEGKESNPYNEDGLRDVYEVSVSLELTDDEVKEDDRGLVDIAQTVFVVRIAFLAFDFIAGLGGVSLFRSLRWRA